MTIIYKPQRQQLIQEAYSLVINLRGEYEVLAKDLETAGNNWTARILDRMQRIDRLIQTAVARQSRRVALPIIERDPVLFYKRIPAQGADYFEIYHGDPRDIAGARLLGTVGPVLGSLNRPTGTWCYTVQETGYMNWRAGRSRDQAAIRLAHKCGIKSI